MHISQFKVKAGTAHKYWFSSDDNRPKPHVEHFTAKSYRLAKAQQPVSSSIQMELPRSGMKYPKMQVENGDQAWFCLGTPLLLDNSTQNHLHSELRIRLIVERRALLAPSLSDVPKPETTAPAAAFGLWCWLLKQQQHFTQSGIKVRGWIFVPVCVCKYDRVGVHSQEIAKPWK